MIHLFINSKLEEQYSEKEEQKRNIKIYKNLLSNKEWEILRLLNLGKEKKYILKSSKYI